MTFPASSVQDFSCTYFVIGATSRLKQERHLVQYDKSKPHFGKPKDRLVHDRKQDAGYYSLDLVSGAPVCVCGHCSILRRSGQKSKTGSVGNEAQCSTGFFFLFCFKLSLAQMQVSGKCFHTDSLLCYTSFLTGLRSKQGWQGILQVDQTRRLSPFFSFLLPK